MSMRQYAWTKRDAFVLMDCDCDACWNSYQHEASFSLWKRCNYSLEFARRWLEYATDPRIVTDRPNEMGLDNLPGFMENRHDQTVMSLLAVKEHVPAYRSPSEVDGPGPHGFSPYGKIMEHTRWKG